MSDHSRTGIRVAFVHGPNRVERVMHGEMHHRQRALSLEGTELVFSERDVVREFVPPDNQRGVEPAGVDAGFQQF